MEKIRYAVPMSVFILLRNILICCHFDIHDRLKTNTMLPYKHANIVEPNLITQY